MKLNLILIALWFALLISLAFWPFNFGQENLANFGVHEGLTFSPPSLAYSEGPPSKIARLDSFAILLSFVPTSGTGSGCILDYGTSETSTNLRIVQFQDRLDVAVQVGESRLRHFRVPPAAQGSLCTVVFTARGKAVTVGNSDTVTASAVTQMMIGATWDPEARLVFGCTVNGKLSWRGMIVRFTVYGPGQIGSLSQHPDALLDYRLAEGSGRSVPDDGCEPRIPLVLPLRYHAPAREYLASPATYWHGRWYASDIINNVIAFLPFGFLLGLLWRFRMKRTSLLLLAAGLACLISLFIESIQYMLPSRDSSIVDVFMNTFGGFIGAWLSTTRLTDRFGLRMLRGRSAGTINRSD